MDDYIGDGDEEGMGINTGTMYQHQGLTTQTTMSC